MKVYRPRSFLTLVLIGFSLVALPLIVGIVYAAASLGRLTHESEQAVYQAVEITQNSWLLSEELTAMERNARQFLVLGDPGLWRAYEDGRARFQATAHRLQQLPLDARQAQHVHDLVAAEQAVHARLLASPRDSAAARQAAATFVDLDMRAHAIADAAGRLIDAEVQSLHATAASTQHRLAWQALALVPGTLVFAGLFTLLISRPMSQLDLAIRRLGDGDFGRGITLTGPRDVQQLGRQLDWLRRRLSEVEKEKVRFLRHVSHELKTPLAAIREGAELLTDEVVGHMNLQQTEVSRILQQNAMHLQKLIEDLLNFNVARTSSQGVDLALLRFDEIARFVLMDHKLSMMKKAVELELNCMPVWVRGDRQKLRVALDNLVSNAIKYSPYGGTITVRLFVRDGHAVLDVIDAGPGINAEERPRVFEAFFQGRPAAHGPIKGTGLGLSIAKEYIDAHNGTIEVVERQGAGAHLRITLELAQPVVQHAS